MSVEFVRIVDKDLAANKTKLLLPAVDRVWIDGEPCFGYFSADDRMLVVAACNPDWLEVLAHEFGHFKQDMEGCTYASAVLCEADAERRALGYLNAFGIATAEQYIPKANGHLFGLVVGALGGMVPLAIMDEIATDPVAQITDEIKKLLLDP